MLQKSISVKKIPRFLLAHPDSYFESIPGLQVLWPDRTYTDVWDLNLSGVAVDAQSQLGHLKLGQSLELRLKVPGFEDSLPLKTRLIRLQARLAGFVFETSSFDNRLVLDQVTKDLLVSSSLKEVSAQHLPQDLQANLWLHGAFDTNVLLWHDDNRLSVRQAVVEYENLLWIYEQGSVKVLKSLPAVDENQLYLKPDEIFSSTTPKVSMGASWMGRLIKILEQVDRRRGGDLGGLLILLRSQRAH